MASAAAAAAASSQHRCVFVGNIPYDATEEQLVQICEEVGPVVSFRLVLDRETGKPKGYGFCEYKDEETALSARRNLQGYEINGRQLRVDFAENDKNADRSREQGRGGPGLISQNDGQKSLPGPPISGDSALHQPIGLQLASTVASTMAKVLGGAQSTSLSSIQNGSQNFSGLGNDPLTLYLSNMSRYQLNEIMSEMKALATQNTPLARQLLQGSPQLSKALFQAQIVLGLVTPQQMQMASTRLSSSSVLPPSLQNNLQDRRSLLPPYPVQGPPQKETLTMFARPPESQVPPVLSNSMIPHQSGPLLQYFPFQPPLQHPLPQPQAQPQGVIPGKFEIPSMPLIQHQNLGVFPVQQQTPPFLPTSRTPISQIQPPILQHPKTNGVSTAVHHPYPTLSSTSLNQPLLPPAITTVSSHHPKSFGLDTLPNEVGRSASGGHDFNWSVRLNTPSKSGSGLIEPAEFLGQTSGPTEPPSKRPRLEDESSAPQPISNVSSATTSANLLQHSDKQSSQLPPEVESVLLQQVMSLTPEQLSSLPPEQREQVLQLQQMLGRL